MTGYRWRRFLLLPVAFPLVLAFCLGSSPRSAFAQNAVSTGTRAGFRMFYPDSNDWWLDPSQGRFDIRANGGFPLATLNALGYLGIGTTGPGVKLEVAGGVLIQDTVLGTRPAAKGILLRFDGTNNLARLDVQDINGADVGGTYDFTINSTILTLDPHNGYLKVGGFGEAAFTVNAGAAGARVNSTVNRIDITGNSTGLGPTLSAQGETNVPLNITGKGTGNIILNGATTGSVGIGTANPGEKFHVDGGYGRFGQSSSFQIRLGADSTSGGGSAWVESPVTTVPLGFWVGGNEKMRITTGGNVGIGTAGPGELLHINKASDGQGMKIQNGAYGGGYITIKGEDLDLGGTVSSYYHTVRFNMATSNQNAGNGADRTMMALFREGWSNYDKVSFPSASVGIGTTNPQGTLDVNGSICISGANCITAWPGATPLGLRQFVSSMTAARFPVQGSAIPLDDTIPQITEGYQVLAAAIAPTRADSRLVIEAVVNYDEPSNSCNGGVLTLFKDGGPDAIAVTGASVYGSELSPRTATMRFVTAAVSTASRTYSLRIGANGANCVEVNREGYIGGNAYGGTMVSSLTIMEVSP